MLENTSARSVPNPTKRENFQGIMNLQRAWSSADQAEALWAKSPRRSDELLIDAVLLASGMDIEPNEAASYWFNEQQKALAVAREWREKYDTMAWACAVASLAAVIEAFVLSARLLGFWR